MPFLVQALAVCAVVGALGLVMWLIFGDDD
jgi:hypothetical protein